MRLQRPHFGSVAAYGRLFTDAAYWRPYVAAICARHEIGPCREIRAGEPGTFPVFIVDEHCVVKLFGDHFDGGARFRVERAMYELLAADRAIPAPPLLASGALFDDADGWPWPYLVIGLIAGESLTGAENRASVRDRRAVCRWLAPIVRRLHALTPNHRSPLPLTWEAFDRFLAERRAGCADNHRAWGSLPEHLIAQIDDYLPSSAELVDRAVPPHVLHADLNADHILGSFTGDRWRPTGIIDFGDALVGDRLYELVVLHIGLFNSDKRLLGAFLDAYGFDDGLRRDFAWRAMALTLLHEFNVLSGVFRRFPDTARVERLTDLAALLWDLERPGLASRR
jgi:hygromycin-B 7''-O-kinase